MGGGGFPKGEIKGTRHSAASNEVRGVKGGVVTVAPSSGMWERSEVQQGTEAGSGAERSGSSPLGGTGRKRVGGGGERREMDTA